MIIILVKCLNNTITNKDLHTLLMLYMDEPNCLIYKHDKSIRLLIFIHQQGYSYIDNNIYNLVEVLNADVADDYNFKYDSRLPTILWKDFCYPYICDNSKVYNIIDMVDVFSKDINVVDKVKSSTDIISYSKYIAKTKFDMDEYRRLDDMYPHIQEKQCTISDLIRSKNNFNVKDVITKMDLVYISYDTAAKILLSYLGHKVLCSYPQTRTFYIFSDIWILDEGCSYIYNVIMNKMPEYTLELARNMGMSIKEDILIPLFYKNRDEILLRLGYLSEAKNINKMLNSRTDIIAFDNGVYDFNNDVFRRGLPEDYISIKTDIPYYVDQSQEDIEELISILLTIFPDHTILEFFLTTMSLVMSGRNYEKIVVIWLGKTDTGKSTCQEFMEHVLGDYCGVLSSSTLVGKRTNPHGTTSALSSIGCKRLLFLQEPEDAKINPSQLKLLAGNDNIYMREIYEKGTSSKIKAITIVVTNSRIDLSGCDEASLSRIVVIPFLSNFVTSRLSYKERNGIEADINIISKLKRLSSTMNYILVEYYKTYLSKGYHIPDVIREHTSDFIMMCNPALCFMKNNTQHKEGAMLDISILYSFFNTWNKESNQSYKTMPMSMFIEIITSNGYSISSNFIENTRLKSGDKVKHNKF